jgi:hypothetical protein
MTKNTLIRKSYPRIRTYPKHGKTYYRVDLRRKHHVGQPVKDFNNEEDAKNFANEIAEQVSKHGVNILATVQDPRTAAWERQCSIFGKTAEDAI